MDIFINNIINIYGEKGKIWLNELPRYIQQFEDLWNLNQLKPLSKLSYNYILSGVQNEIPIILKLSPSQEELNREAQALSIFNGYGAISVLEHQNQALLLQQAIPGTSLKDCSTKENIQIACKVIEKLRQVPLPQEMHFPHIKEWLTTLDKAWNLPTKHLERARRLKSQLLSKNSELETLLHGDLHQDNILLHKEDWVVIDPKGVVGYPINEIWACVEHPSYDLKYLAEYFNYSFEDVVGWYYVQLILAACWQVEDHLNPNLFLKLAESVIPMLKL